MTAKGRGGAAPRLPRRLAGGRPKGEQLREILEGLASSLPPGSALPSERELADRYGVARMTVRGEIDRLTGEGLTYRQHGRGTFVAAPRVAQAVALTSFTEDMRSRGMEPSSQVLDQELVEASSILAARLEIGPSAPTMRLDRVRTADGIAMAFERAYLPAARFAGIESTDFSRASLFELLAERWGVVLRDADQRVVATAIEGEQAALLEVAEGEPGLRFQTLTRDAHGAPVYYAISLYRGDRYEIDLRQVRGDGRARA
ncbi:MAG: UTRA domain-containing protein [Solirubrobacterales bacterium]|nr:UTRA domain-containing protein [Solirubrobacterales bacterium]